MKKNSSVRASALQIALAIFVLSLSSILLVSSLANALRKARSSSATAPWVMEHTRNGQEAETTCGDQYMIASGTDPIVPGVTDTGNHCDDCDTLITLPFSFQLYGNTYSTVNVSSNGRLDFVCANEPDGVPGQGCLPANPNQCSYDYTIFGLWQYLSTEAGLSGCSGFPGGSCGIYTSVSGDRPHRIFNIEWRAVLSYLLNAPRNNFEIRLYENDPNKRFDVIYGTIDTTGSYTDYVAGVQGNSNCSLYTQDFCGRNPPQNVSRTYTLQVSCPTPTPCGNCGFSSGAGTFVPGVTDIGNHTDDGSTFVTLPFPVTLYGNTYTGAYAGSNGHLTFGTPYDYGDDTCWPSNQGTYVLAPYWIDQCTTTCIDADCIGCGIFTTTTGAAPNRVFYVEYRTNYYALGGQTQLLDYEVALYENGNPSFRFIYGNIVPPAAPLYLSQLVVGVKRDNNCFTQFGCDPGGRCPPVSSGQQLTLMTCAAPTPTPTGTPSPTPTPRATATPRPQLTPAPRP